MDTDDTIEMSSSARTVIQDLTEDEDGYGGMAQFFNQNESGSSGSGSQGSYIPLSLISKSQRSLPDDKNYKNNDSDEAFDVLDSKTVDKRSTPRKLIRHGSQPRKHKKPPVCRKILSSYIEDDSINQQNWEKAT